MAKRRRFYKLLRNIFLNFDDAVPTICTKRAVIVDADDEHGMRRIGRFYLSPVSLLSLLLLPPPLLLQMRSPLLHCRFECRQSQSGQIVFSMALAYTIEHSSPRVELCSWPSPVKE
jgi:hypothetical protein